MTADDVTLSRNETVPGDRARLFARVNNGDLVRISRGAYLATELWAALSPDGRWRAVAAAAQAMSPGELVFSHSSAAALWRLPYLAPFPSRAEVTVAAASGGRSNRALRAHAVGRVQTTEHIDGFRVTTLDRTIIDLAATIDFGPAVALTDAGLRRTLHPVDGVPRTWVSTATLNTELSSLPLTQGRVRAIRSVSFAEGRADRPGESLSRVTMHRAGISAPQLQVELRGASGRRYVVDFWWPEFGAFGEFDGKRKYSDPEFLRGRTPAQALLDEKGREDDLRATGRVCARWGWDVAESESLLRKRLALAGVR